MRIKKAAEHSPCRRRWQRIKTNGIVALSSCDTPIVSQIHDIAQGGVSFLYANEADVIGHEFPMEILIFDILQNFEYHVSHLTGQVKRRHVVMHPKNKVPVWRYHVEFVDLDRKTTNKLQTFCDPVKRAAVLVV